MPDNISMQMLKLRASNSNASRSYLFHRQHQLIGWKIIVVWGSEEIIQRRSQFADQNGRWGTAAGPVTESWAERMCSYFNKQHRFVTIWVAEPARSCVGKQFLLITA